MANINQIAGGSSPTASGGNDAMSAFRSADFMKILLTEVTNQNPMDPQDSSKMVESMQQLQTLANTQYQAFRGDITWAQNLLHQTVSVQQQALDPAQKEALTAKGLKPDVGYAQVSGLVTSFRVVDQTVYVTVADKDYPISNVKQIVPDTSIASYMAQMADQLLGKNVVYKDAVKGTGNGTVTAVMTETDGSLALEVGGKKVPYKNVIQIGVAAKPTATTN